jgi:hypothetical protein
VEWSPAIVIPGRHGRTILDQELRNIEVPVAYSAVQGSLVLIALAVNIRTSLDEKLCEVELPTD